MSKANFTPGPWKLAPSSIEDAQGKTVCYFEVAEGATADVFENAKLIAAAPKMYDFLKDVLDNNTGIVNMLEIADILAKARGES